MEEQEKINPLGTEKISRLMLQFSVPSIIAMVIGAVYNIVDQLFIGNMVGTLGNAATNVVFPMTTVCTSLALLCGIGGAASFNLSLGRGDSEEAVHYVGNSLVLLVSCGVILCVIVQIFMRPLLGLLGTTESVYPYAASYLRITSIGFPFLILTTGGGHLIRADGSPKMAMACTLTGAIINTGLDALFVVGFRWGMQGAALATIIGQIVSAIMVIVYMTRFKTVPLHASHLRLNGSYARRLTSIGMAPCFNQLGIMVSQIVMNQLLVYYGAMSVYGPEIPLACCGIIMKVYQIFFMVIVGLAQGAQPIESFNYGARQYARVRETYRNAVIVGGIICVCSFVIFRIFPRQILLLFGSNTEEYFEFGVMFFRVFMLFSWLAFGPPLTSNFFTAIGKPKRGIFVSLTRQLILFVPLALILPLFFKPEEKIRGLLFSAPIADVGAFCVAMAMISVEWRRLKRMEAEQAAEIEEADSAGC